MPQSLASGAGFPRFLRAFTARWFTAMSGPLTVPFALLALFRSGPSSRIAFGTLAIGCGVFSSYCVWRTERLALLEERERQGGYLRQKRERLYEEILEWCNRFEIELMTSKERGEFEEFALRLWKSEPDFEKLISRMELYCSTATAVQMFRNINQSLVDFAMRVRFGDKKTGEEVWQIVEDGLLRLLEPLRKQMQSELGITTNEAA